MPGQQDIDSYAPTANRPGGISPQADPRVEFEIIRSAGGRHARLLVLVE